MKLCPICGFDNEDTDKTCTMCGEKLDGNAESGGSTVASEPVHMSAPSLKKEEAAPSLKKEEVKPAAPKKTGAKRFVVNCDTSRTKTVVSSKDITSYYCEGCKEEHQIDGFFLFVEEEEETAPEAASSKTNEILEKVNSGNGDHLVLEDLATHYKIEVGPEGGVLGRYGTLGAEYFQSDPRGGMVSGEHCRITYDLGRWAVEHLSRTNDTVNNGKKMEHGYSEVLRDGKVLTLANAISFSIKIY